ncbi:hypothetical protein Tco_0345604 [Tanacetum coccineum]
MPTEMELTREQTQQGVSYEVSNIRVILFTVKMEILLEPTSNKLMVDSILQLEILSRRFFLNLPDHRSILTDSKMEVKIYDSFATVYLLYGSAGVRVITAAGGRSYKENSRFKRKVATDLYKLYSSYISCWIESEYMSAYSFVLVTLDNTYWSLGSCWFHHVPADCWSWFLLVGFVVPTGLLMVSAACLVRYCLLLLLVL